MTIPNDKKTKEVIKKSGLRVGGPLVKSNEMEEKELQELVEKLNSRAETEGYDLRYEITPVSPGKPLEITIKVPRHNAEISVPADVVEVMDNRGKYRSFMNGLRLLEDQLTYSLRS